MLVKCKSHVRAFAHADEVLARTGDATPGRTPFSSYDATPTHFDRTPLTAASQTPGPSRHPREQADAAPRVDANLSLDAFQARYTSQDNASFQDLVVADSAARREKHAWAWHAEKKANTRAIKAREARERLVEVTRRMVESSGDGTVRLLDGPAGKPGERRLLVDEGVDVGTGPENRLLVTGRDEKERLLITNGEGSAEARSLGRRMGEEEKVDERAQQFIDWDKATAEEKYDNKAIEEDQLQVPTSAWPFKVRSDSGLSTLERLRNLPPRLPRLTRSVSRRPETRSCSLPTPIGTTHPLSPVRRAPKPQQQVRTVQLLTLPPLTRRSAKRRRRSCLASRRVFAIMRRGCAIWRMAGVARAQVGIRTQAARSAAQVRLEAASGPRSRARLVSLSRIFCFCPPSLPRLLGSRSSIFTLICTDRSSGRLADAARRRLLVRRCVARTRPSLPAGSSTARADDVGHDRGDARHAPNGGG